ncbi:MAG TPA: SDR family NAD(P)-dependent oxidoreductase, partial [Thermomicrobiales bacterium]|nr:SDR family NAD(P)-dependent oxidoreductase [Thermomicrobiales bacterium]
MSVKYDFGGQAVIVTGASRGVGRVMVERFVAAGAAVVAADRDEAGLAETVAALPGDRVAAVAADVSEEAGAKAIVAAAVARFGRLDVCVNDA